MINFIDSTDSRDSYFIRRINNQRTKVKVLI